MHSRNSLVESREQTPKRVAVLTPRRLSIEGAVARFRTLPPRQVALGIIIVTQTLLLFIALVPQNIWASNGMPGGPIPSGLEPVVAALFYALPSLTGFVARRWQAAIVLATLPAWLDLGVFAIAAATRVGPYYLTLEPHAISTVGTLELFAALGALGWLSRPIVKEIVGWIRRMVAS